MVEKNKLNLTLLHGRVALIQAFSSLTLIISHFIMLQLCAF